MAGKPWRLRLICCGRDDGEERFATWEEADAFRQSYTSGPGVGMGGHDRAAILEHPMAGKTRLPFSRSAPRCAACGRKHWLIDGWLGCTRQREAPDGG